MIKKNISYGFGSICLACIMLLLFSGTGVFARTETRFFMEVDTTFTGIRVGQEVELTYSCTVPFDSVIPPEFGEEIEVVRGPEPSRVMSTEVVDGEKKQVNQIGFTFDVRFLNEGIVSLPLASVKAGGREYRTPPLSVRVKPALRDIRGGGMPPFHPCAASGEGRNASGNAFL